MEAIKRLLARNDRRAAPHRTAQRAVCDFHVTTTRRTDGRTDGRTGGRVLILGPTSVGSNIDSD